MPINYLYVARDDSTTIVSRRRITVTGVGTRTSRWGGLEETVSVRQSLLPAVTPGRAAAVVVPPGLTAGALWLAGVGTELVVGAGAAVFLAGAYLTPWLARLRPAAKRDGGQGDKPFRTLFDRPEQQLFEQTLDVARRITETWPDLSGLVDHRDAVWALNQALWDMADLLSAHQGVRRIAEALEAQGTGDTPIADAVSHNLADQLTTARERLRRLNHEVTSRMMALEAAESAGRRFIREIRLIQTLRETAQSLSTEPAEPMTDTGAELAEQTTAVIDAYRELSPDFNPRQ